VHGNYVDNERGRTKAKLNGHSHGHGAEA
jgi:hypothetical protein